MRPGQAIVEAEGQFQTAAQAGAVDEGGRRKRQPFEAGDDVQAALHQFAVHFRRAGRTAQFLQIGPGNENARLGADEHQAAHVVAAFSSVSNCSHSARIAWPRVLAREPTNI